MRYICLPCFCICSRKRIIKNVLGKTQVEVKEKLKKAIEDIGDFLSTYHQ